jgi:hypothetical protein
MLGADSVGSNPGLATTYTERVSFGTEPNVPHWLEHQIPNLRVTGSNPVGVISI